MKRNIDKLIAYVEKTVKEHELAPGCYGRWLIQDANGKVLSSYTAKNSYAAGGDLLDHIYVALPDDAATILIAGNTYQARPELTLVYPSN